jgi:hypothetical protein
MCIYMCAYVNIYIYVDYTAKEDYSCIGVVDYDYRGPVGTLEMSFICAYIDIHIIIYMYTCESLIMTIEDQ